MALIKSNVAWWQMGKQGVKGTPQGTMAGRWYFAGDERVAPRSETAVFAETDSSRDAPNSEKVGGGLEGGASAGLRDKLHHKIAEAALGTKVTTGSTNFTHTITGATTLDYWTVEQMLGDTLWEQFVDCVVGEWTVTGEAGGFLTTTLSFMGITPTRLTSVPAGSPPISDSTLYTFNDATISIGGSATGLVRSFNMTLSNNLQSLQTDALTPYDIHVGQREVTLGFDMLFENLDHYNAFHYGGVSGTVQSSSTYTTDALFSFSKGANNSVDYDFDSLNFEEYPVGQDTGGDPIVVAVRARARRNGNGLIRAIVKNQQAT